MSDAERLTDEELNAAIDKRARLLATSVASESSMVAMATILGILLQYRADGKRLAFAPQRSVCALPAWATVGQGVSCGGHRGSIVARDEPLDRVVVRYSERDSVYTIDLLRNVLPVDAEGRTETWKIGGATDK